MLKNTALSFLCCQMCFQVMVTPCFLGQNGSQPVGGLKKPAPAFKVHIIPCGSVTKSKGSYWLFLWSCQMFLWVLHSWHKAFSPEMDRIPCSCFCGKTHFKVWLLSSAGVLVHLWPCSLTFYLQDFLMLLFLFDLVLFMSSLVEGKGLSPPSSPSVHVTSHGWQQHSSFGIH